MTTEKITIKHIEEELEAPLKLAEEFANSLGAKNRDILHMRLITEEMMELVRVLGAKYHSQFRIDEDNKICRLRLYLKSDSKEESIREAEPAAGVSGKIRFLLEEGYEGISKIEKKVEKYGIRKADSHILEEMGAPAGTDAYVWTLEAYGLISFDATQEADSEDWIEIGSSIIANLSDDVQLFIYRDKIELVALKSLQEKEEKKYEISPEFEALYKVPVAKSRIQVRIVQLIYNRLVNKQSSTKNIKITKTEIASESSPKGKLTALIYSAANVEDDDILPCVLFLHGGAFLFPALPYHYRLAEKIATQIRCRVIMPMYDLAPDYVPPIQQEEVFDVYKSILEHPLWYHADTERIAVIGDSAGGTLTAALTIMAKKRNLKQPKAQALFYPSLDERLRSKSMKQYTDVPVINAKAIREYYKLCKNDEYNGDRDLISPLTSEDLSGLPDAYIETAEYDALHDDGIAYAKRLIDAGTKVTLNETKGTVHAFDMASNSDILARVIAKRIQFLRRELEQ